MSENPVTIMDRLREATRDLHSHAESRPLQRQIARGEVERNLFAAYLGQLYLVHDKLETALDHARSSHPPIDSVATAERMRRPDLERDLEFYELNPHTIEPTAASRRFMELVDRLETEDPVALLGSLYVLEGSTNGGRYLAKILRRAWQLDDEGLSYFDPYGDEQPARWAAFKTDMGRIDLDARQRDAVVDAAMSTFQAIANVSDELASSRRPTDGPDRSPT